MANTILVTGAAGFIGFHLSKKLLGENYKVVGIDNLNDYYDVKLKESRLEILKKMPGFTFYKMDFSKRINLPEKIDAICHLGAYPGIRFSMENPIIYEQSNILGTLQVFEYAKKNNIKQVVYASSSSVYGNNNKLPLKESYETNEQLSIYAMTKKSDELISQVYHKNYKINVTGLRFFTVYGPFGRPDMALYKFAKNISEKKEIEVYNNGLMKRDFTYIDDAVNGILLALQKNYPNEIFNIGSGSQVNLMEFIKLIEKNLNENAIIKYLPIQPGESTETLADISKAKKMLNYNPMVSISRGIKEFIEWYAIYSKNL